MPAPIADHTQSLDCRHRRCPAGLTLLELLLAISIAAIVLAASLPAMGGFVLNQRMDAEAQRLQQFLRHARVMAISRSAIVVVCPSDDGQRCRDDSQWQYGWLMFEDRNRDRERQAAEPRLRVGSGMPGLAANSSVHRTRLRFYANGTAPGTAATLVLCDARGAPYAEAVSIANSGRIQRKSARRGELKADCPGTAQTGG